MRNWPRLKQTRYVIAEIPAVLITAPITNFSKIDVPVNAPEAGTIKELLVSEEDTVTVGQDLLRLELGEAPADGGKKEGAAPKKPTKEEHPAESPKKTEETSVSESKPAKESQPKQTQQEKKPAPVKPESSETNVTPADGNRGERRVMRLLTMLHCGILC